METITDPKRIGIPKASYKGRCLAEFGDFYYSEIRYNMPEYFILMKERFYGYTLGKYQIYSHGLKRLQQWG